MRKSIQRCSFDAVNLVVTLLMIYTLFINCQKSDSFSENRPLFLGVYELARINAVNNITQDDQTITGVNTISGTLVGYNGSGLELTLFNETDYSPVEILSIPAGSANFTFTSELLENSFYSVAVTKIPINPYKQCYTNSSMFNIFTNNGVSFICVGEWT